VFVSYTTDDRPAVWAEKSECPHSFSNAVRTLAMVAEAGLEPTTSGLWEGVLGMIIAHFSAKPAYFQGNQIHSVGVHRVLWAAGIRCCALNVRQGIPGYWSDERLSKERLLLSGHSAPCACHLCVFTIYQIETRVTTGTSTTLQWRLKY
jgi:hypothetical protein